MYRRDIEQSVGNQGVNRPEDVQDVQELLNLIPAEQGGAEPLLTVDQICGQKTIAAIHRFQLMRFGWSGADGRADPEHKTIRWMRALEGEFGSSEFKIARCELAAPYPVNTDSFWAIFARNQVAEFALGPTPIVKGSQIPITFKDENSFHKFTTMRLQSARSLQAANAGERIQPHPDDPEQSLVFLRIDLPSTKYRTDIVDAFFPHQWVNKSNMPPGNFRLMTGGFYLLKKPRFGV